MARNSSSLHIGIPQSTLQPHNILKNDATPGSPGYFQPKEEASFSFTRNGSQYLASPSSVTSASPMMIPVPFKIQVPISTLTLTPHPTKDEKRRLSEYEFPAPAAKVDTLYQSYLNQPFTQLRQQRLQEHQTQQQQYQKRTYASKYANYTNSSQTIVRSHSLGSQKKPSTNLALSMIEKEKMAFQCSPSNRDSVVSPPPPPYLNSDHGVDPLDQSFISPSGLTMITPASLAWSKRNSLPLLTSSRSAASIPSLSNQMTRTARELKRHSLPVTSSATSAGTPQWPSAMTLAMTAVTRPKLARTMPPQAIPILYTGETKSPLPTSTATAIFTPRTSRLLEKGETDTLYSYKLSEDGQNSPRSASFNAGPRTKDHNFIDMQRTRIVSGTSQGQFPGFWKDAKQHRMHWMFISLSVVSAGAAICLFLMVPTLFIWSAALPGVLAILLGAQYAGYKWRERKHLKQLLKHRRLSATGLSSMRAASAALTNSCSALTPSGTNAVPSSSTNHAHRSSHSSMHTSVGSICSDSFLEPHQPSPPNILKSQFQHQYFRTNSSSTNGSPLQFTDGYSNSSQHSHHHGVPLPEYRQSWDSVQSQKSQGSQKNRSRTIQRQDSFSSIASSETVSSTSTSSELEYAVSDSPTATHLDFGLASSIKSTLEADALVALPDALKSSDSLNSLDSATMVPLSPAYISKKCGEVVLDQGETLSEKAMALFGVELPEITPVGDLVSEFAFDFGTIQY
ncbi:hypothetical protein BGX27_000939 [Mortierella sp. AM989]|nr:hypothetical protein BGX27_000939 [Mortierella sp. AM989]